MTNDDEIIAVVDGKKQGMSSMSTKIKKWEHLPIRPSTFEEFRKLKDNFRSDNAFVLELLKNYKKSMGEKE